MVIDPLILDEWFSESALVIEAEGMFWDLHAKANLRSISMEAAIKAERIGTE